MITVYGREDCSYCDNAKEMLDNLDLEYSYIDVKKP